MQDAVGWQDAKPPSDALKAAQRLTHALQDSPQNELASCVRQAEVGPGAVRITLDLADCGLQPPGAGPGEALKRRVVAARRALRTSRASSASRGRGRPGCFATHR